LNTSLDNTKRIYASSKFNAHEAMESFLVWKLLPYGLVNRRGGTWGMILQGVDYYAVPDPCVRHLEANSIHVILASWQKFWFSTICPPCPDWIGPVSVPLRQFTHPNDMKLAHGLEF
jgi:hypothetical protein